MNAAPALLAVALTACTGRPQGTPSINRDPAAVWPEVPSLDAAITARMERDRVAGLAACVGRAGELLWCGGYGLANPDTGLLATPSTPFLLASVSKAVVGVVVQQEIERGTFALSTGVSDVLPFDVVHPDEPSAEISLRHLVTHTSGILDNWDVLDTHYVDGDSPLPLGAFLEGYLTPGGADYDDLDNWVPDGVDAVFEYSNVGAALAAYTVEAAVGVPFDARCEAQVFEPLGLNAGWHLADFDPDDVAAPTLVSGGAFETVPHFGVPDYPDGQLRADARSMARLVMAVANGGSVDGVRILSAESAEDLTRPLVPNLEPGMALLWYSWDLDGERVIGHNGGETGTSTEVWFRPSDGLVVVVLMNSEGRAGTLAAVERALAEAASDL